MQRKNYFLKHKKHRNGFAMIMAITVIVIVATILAIGLSMTAVTAKRTTNLFLYEQAILLSKSATEYALLKISQNKPCSVTSINMKKDPFNDDDDNGIFDINITMKYVYKGNVCSDSNDQYINITTDEQNGSVLMDVSISVTDDTVSSEPIRYFRRTMQKL